MHRHARFGRRRGRFGGASSGRGHCGPGFRTGRRVDREEWLRSLEEYQKDLEQEVADVADLIRRLKQEPAETASV